MARGGYTVCEEAGEARLVRPVLHHVVLAAIAATSARAADAPLVGVRMAAVAIHLHVPRQVLLMRHHVIGSAAAIGTLALLLLLLLRVIVI